MSLKVDHDGFKKKVFVNVNSAKGKEGSSDKDLCVGSSDSPWSGKEIIQDWNPRSPLIASSPFSFMNSRSLIG